MTTVDIFLKQKLSNFILYLEGTIGVNNKLYPQVKQLDETSLIKYADYVSKVAKINPTNSKLKYYFEETTIIDYLENNGFKKEEYIKLDDGKFVEKLKRYLELFVNTIC